jgi:hypothetical protein
VKKKMIATFAKIILTSLTTKEELVDKIIKCPRCEMPTISLKIHNSIFHPQLKT